MLPVSISLRICLSSRAETHSVTKMSMNILHKGEPSVPIRDETGLLFGAFACNTFCIRSLMKGIVWCGNGQGIPQFLENQQFPIDFQLTSMV